jgi:hypothetical protein
MAAFISIFLLQSLLIFFLVNILEQGFGLERKRLFTKFQYLYTNLFIHPYLLASQEFL